jgi:hypothetical protein
MFNDALIAKISTHTGNAGHILVKINKGMLLNDSGGLDTPPIVVVIPRPMSRAIYTVTPKAAKETMYKG